MVNLYTDPKESLEAAREWAVDIMKAGQSLDNGNGLPDIELDIFDIDLTNLLFSLRAGGFDTAGAAAYIKPTQVQIDKVAEAFGPDYPRLDELYETGQKILAYIAKKAWGIMQQTTLDPDEMTYLSLHSCLEQMAIDPQSDEALKFLGGISREEFESVDHPHALNSIYVDYRAAATPLLSIEILAGLRSVARNSDVPIDMKGEFEKRKESAIQGLEADLERTIHQSHLSEMQVLEYLAFRDKRIAEQAKINPPLGGMILPQEGPKGMQ